MTRFRAVTAAALAAAVLGAGAAPSATPRPVVPARVQVVADEFSLRLSRRSIKAGPAVVELVNFGEDDHDLRLRRRAPHAVTLTIERVLPGHSRQLRARLAPGVFVLWCSIADHRAHGMQTTLRVMKR